MKISANHAALASPVGVYPNNMAQKLRYRLGC